MSNSDFPIAFERQRGGVEETKDDEECSRDSENRDDAYSATSQGKSTSRSMDMSSLATDLPSIEITNLPVAIHGMEESSERWRTRRGEEGSVASSVNFGSVQVREYERVIDSTNIYMGLALGWNYNEKVPTPIVEREKASKCSVSSSHGGESRMKRTNGSDRYGMLIRYGYAQKELKNATKEAAKFYKERQRDAARPLVVADQTTKPKRRMLLRSLFG
jgi:hypothetical protein